MYNRFSINIKEINMQNENEERKDRDERDEGREDDEHKDGDEKKEKINLTPASVVVKEKNNEARTWKLVTILLAVVILGLGGFIVWDKTANSSNIRSTTGSSKNKTSGKDSEKEGDKKEDDKVAVKRDGYMRQWQFGNFYVTSKGEVYFDFFVPSNSPIQFKLNEKGMPAERGNYTFTKDDIANFWTVNEDDNSMTVNAYKIKIDSKIVGVTDMGWGQNAITYDYGLISEDGNLSILSVHISGDITLDENVGGYENVAYTAITEGSDESVTTIFFRDGTYKIVKSREEL